MTDSVPDPSKPVFTIGREIIVSVSKYRNVKPTAFVQFQVEDGETYEEALIRAHRLLRWTWFRNLQSALKDEEALGDDPYVAVKQFFEKHPQPPPEHATAKS